MTSDAATSGGYGVLVIQILGNDEGPDLPMRYSARRKFRQLHAGAISTLELAASCVGILSIMKLPKNAPTKSLVIVLSDNSPTIHTLNKWRSKSPDLNSTMNKFLTKFVDLGGLSALDFCAEHLKGEFNITADTLSRLSTGTTHDNTLLVDEQLESEIFGDVFAM
jgi:hypothetical protein